jgi:FMN phosphatase YigB (HAD superfamily)
MIHKKSYKKQKIIFDFDYTLFSAKKLFKYLKEEFKKIGISDELFSETFQKSKDNLGYNPKKQFGLITKENPKVNLKILEAAYKKVISQANQFLYPDVLPVLRNLEKENELIILSYGEKEFQREKIENSKITQYFNKIIVTQEINKISEIRKVLEEEKNIIFVEDNPKTLVEAKKIFPNILTIRINRGEGKYTKEPDNEKIDFVIENLEGLKKIINHKFFFLVNK